MINQVFHMGLVAGVCLISSIFMYKVGSNGFATFALMTSLFLMFVHYWNMWQMEKMEREMERQFQELKDKGLLKIITKEELEKKLEEKSNE